MGLNCTLQMVPFLYLMACTNNNFIHGVAAARCASEIVALPAIRVMIVHFGDPPAVPDVDVIMPAQELMMWIKQLRTTRQEKKTFIEGTYIAGNTSYGSWSQYLIPANAGNHLAIPPLEPIAAQNLRGVISTHHESNNTFNWPVAWDVNYTARIMEFVECEQFGSDYQQDLDAFSTMTNEEYISMMAAVSTLQDTTVTSVMYSYQIGATQMEQVCRQNANVTPYFRPRLEYLCGEEFIPAYVCSRIRQI